MYLVWYYYMNVAIIATIITPIICDRFRIINLTKINYIKLNFIKNITYTSLALSHLKIIKHDHLGHTFKLSGNCSKIEGNSNFC